MTVKSIPTRKLGKNGPDVPALGLGLMGMSTGNYGAIPSDEERFEFLDRAYEIGATFWDSADLYGDNEALIGKWFKRTGKRNEIFLATKFGFVKGSKTFEIDSTYEYAHKAIDESLRVLGVDYIDLWYLHHPNPNTPIEQTMRAMKEIKAAGKVKYIGLSAITSSTLHRALKICPVDAVQVDYSPFVREIEGPVGTHLLTACHELGIAMVPAMPLGRGMITSTFATGETQEDMRVRIFPRFSEENKDNNVKIITQFKAFADKKGISVAQLALAWLLKQSDDIIPIPGTKKIKYLEENWEALNIKLSDEEEKEIRQFLESSEIAGDPLPAAFAGWNYRDTVEEEA